METTNVKSFWKRPEGKPGMVVLIAMIGFGCYFLYKFLPYLITLLQNTLYAGFLIGVIVAIIAIVSDKRFRITISYLFKGLMRAFTGIVIELNPIAILETYVEKLQTKIFKMNEQLGLLEGQ